ncbi:hypothetical protein [Deinococcus sp. PESE-13]
MDYEVDDLISSMREAETPQFVSKEGLQLSLLTELLMVAIQRHHVCQEAIQGLIECIAEENIQSQYLIDVPELITVFYETRTLDSPLPKSFWSMWQRWKLSFPNLDLRVDQIIVSALICCMEKPTLPDESHMEKVLRMLLEIRRDTKLAQTELPPILPTPTMEMYCPLLESRTSYEERAFEYVKSYTRLCDRLYQQYGVIPLPKLKEKGRHLEWLSDRIATRKPFLDLATEAGASNGAYSEAVARIARLMELDISGLN